MHNWHQTAGAVALALVLSVSLAPVSNAQNLSRFQGGNYCGVDLNGDGDFDGKGEIALCDNGVCPLTATECETGRVQQVCEPDKTVTSCAPDEVVEECAPDRTRRECDPDIVREVCEPDVTREVCGPTRSEKRCTPGETHTICDPDTVTQSCDPDTQVYHCDPDTTRRVCNPDTVSRVCDQDTTRRVCLPNTTRIVCEADTVRRVCTTSWEPSCRTRSSRRCAPCTTEITPGRCYSVSVPGACHNERVPGQCRNVTTPGTCYNEQVQGQCRWNTVNGACRNVTIPGECRDITEPDSCHTIEIAGECEQVTEPGACRDVTVPGECTTRTIPGDCVTETVPGECRDEPLPDVCPLGEDKECRVGTDGVSRCADTACVNTNDLPIEELKRERLAYVNDGTISQEGECLNEVQVFTGRGMDCQRPGFLTLFKNCCKNRGTVLRDGGGSLGTAATVSTVTAVFSGASAAASALASGASAASAASVGTAALSAAAGPAAIAAGVYLVFSELLGFGCEQQDFETALLEGSGMCHFVGSYCVARIPLIGCIQKARSFCCFNSKLGRIIHEQGRAQLKAFDGFGEPKNPECRGFTPAEFQALNFSDMDLSEYYGELATHSEAQLKDTFEQGLDAFIQAGKDQ